MLGGDGTTGSVNVGGNGFIGAGNSAGSLNIDGTYEQFGTMVVELEGGGVGGMGAGTLYDLLDVSGIATLQVGSIIDVNLLTGFNPTDGSYFDILTSLDINGATNSLAGISFDYPNAMLLSNLTWQEAIVSSGGGEALRLSVVASAIHEPGSFAILVLGSLATFLAPRRRCAG